MLKRCTGKGRDNDGMTVHSEGDCVQTVSDDFNITAGIMKSMGTAFVWDVYHDRFNKIKS